MTPLFLDFETFYSPTHSLTKLSPMEYVMHPETEIISCSWALGTGPVEMAWGEEEVAARLARLPWDDVLAVGHNMSGFDALLLWWQLGLKPRMWGCTLAMARPLYAKACALGLGHLVKYLGLGTKDGEILITTRGRHLKDFTPEERRLMAEYNIKDTDLCRRLFYHMLPRYNQQELWHIHAKINSFVDSPLILDVPLLEQALVQEKARKRTSLLNLAQVLQVQADTEANTLEAVREQLSSGPKFAALLENLGAPVPMKPSPTDPEKMIPALAKKDKGMEALLEDPNELVAAAAAARLEEKSTITETRIEKFIHAARHSRGHWPVTAHYCGADTTGRGSGWHYNPYNLPRIGETPRPSDALRGSIVAPPGHVIVVVDLSGIEMRFNHTLWGVPYSTQLWRDRPDADIYRAYSAMKFAVPEDQVTKAQRMAGKVDQLGLGFGMGPATYVETARIMSGGKLRLTLQDAQAAVTGWRELHPEICVGWKTCHQALTWIAAGKEIAIDPNGLFVTCKEGIRLPSGRIIRYPDLRQEQTLEYPKNADGSPDMTRDPWVKNEWVYGQGRHKARIYAGKVDENIVQAGARDVFYEALFDIYRATGIPHVHEVYDEGIWVVPDADAESFIKLVHERLRTPPRWFPQLVTWSEGDIGGTYADAK